MINPNLCLSCGVPAPDGICDGCWRVIYPWRFLGLVAGIALFLAALFGFWCAT